MTRIKTIVIFLIVSLTTSVLLANVKLMKANSISRAHYGISSTTKTFVIKVKDLGEDKNIAIHGEYADGTWGNYDAVPQKLADTEDGYEIWKVSTYWSVMDQTERFGSMFVVKYEVNGDVYWDNNNSQNYSLGNHDGTMIADNSVDVSLEYAAMYSNNYNNTTSFYGAIDIRNISYDKQVKVVYSTDNWETVKVLNAQYRPVIYPSYSSPIASPNAYGVEKWDFRIDIDGRIDSVDFAISYDVDGQQTKWDNNSGNDYHIVNSSQN